MKNIIRELRFPSISPDTHGDIVDVIYHENSNARGDMALIDDRVKSLVLQNPRYKQCTTVHLTPLFSKRQYRTLNHHGYTMRADCYYRGYYIGSEFFGIMYRRPKDWHPRRSYSENLA